MDLDLALPERLDRAIEAAAYFVVSGAVTNAAKHAQAQSLSVAVAATDGNLSVTVADDGVGGADTGRGSGLTGLADRVEALGGRLEIDSPRGEGTRIRARLPTQVLGSLNGVAQAS